ncbi:TadE/TadG family type IV pilus assembly protein [Ralstonia soli]|uniref:Pilus assembly protein n=1 Tax=Ralstonia soli TaxID=2953896 RepID=A0ABT1AJV8_9RALS|nr:TadE/TadG family type IV pilus assembly protein [Ralstonia soli]MCO5398544.1 pilus assembly protein [Ralstonia soli]
MKTRQRGVALVELAIVISILLAITFAITEFGRAIYTYNTLTKAARDAARYLSTQAAGSTAAYATATNLAVYGKPTVSGTPTPLAPGLAANMVSICDASNTSCTSNIAQGTNPAINTVTVAISGYPFVPALDLLAFTRFYSGGTGSITAITFGSISVTMRQAYE